MKKKVKTKAKKLLNIFLVIAILISQFSFPAWMVNVSANETTIATKYFYKQLDTPNQKVFYKAMETMLEKGYFKMGNASMEVTNLDLTKDNQTLLAEMGAARDAFMLDYPDLFYVDFDYLSMKVISEGFTNHIYIGTGRGENYINREFLKENGSIDADKIEKAINTVNSRIDAVVTAAAKKSTTKEKVKYAHDAVIEAAKYTLEYDTNHPYTIRDVYGVFGLGSGKNAGNAACEGFARALKTVLDRLEIPAILIRGYYQDPNGKPEEHMWVYVQLDDGNWYAVDPTFDNSRGTTEDSAKLRYNYFLVGEDVMVYHYPVGILSTSDFQFTYPELIYSTKPEAERKAERKDDGTIVYDNGSGIVIKRVPCDSSNTSECKVVYRVSYNGHGYAKAIEEDNVYMLMDWITDFSTKEGLVENSGMVYIMNPVNESLAQFKDTDEYISIEANSTYFKVGITEKAPLVEYDPETAGTYKDPDEIHKMQAFYGNDNEILATSDVIETGLGQMEYPAPHVKKSNPSMQVKQTTGRTFNVTIEYTDEFVYAKDGADITGGTLKD